MSGEPAPAQPPPQVPRGNLAPVALGLGIPGLLLALVPFYGTFLALPLSVAAVVLGLTARGRPEESRPQALGGLVTGGVGVLILVGWLGWFGLAQSGFGTYMSESSMQVESGSATSVVVPESAEESDDRGRGGSATVTPGGDGQGLRTGLSGDAELTLDGRVTSMVLTECALSRGAAGGVLVRGDGPDGRLVVTESGRFSDAVMVVLEPVDDASGVYSGELRGRSTQHRGGGLFTDRHRFELEGTVRDVHTGEPVELQLTITCD